jgi:ligand-binding SRPBCC domain-containing protein
VYYELTDHFHVAADIDRCWRFFGSARNLPLITPPWLAFNVAMAEPLPEITLDSFLDYTIKWSGVPIRWRTMIIDWSPPRQFIDLQVRGPYALWHHQHTFTPVLARDGGGVACLDRVIYQLPVPGVRRVVHWFMVKKQLIEIFRFRRQVIGEHLGWVKAIQPDVQIRSLR